MVSTDLVMAAVVTVSTALGGFSAGKRSAQSAASTIASETVDMLQAQIETLKDDREERDAELADLRTRVDLLENLVTQRAEVDLVHEEVRGARVVLDKIAIKVGAA